MTEWLQCRNWEHWQTYRRDRNPPPWIKVHRRILQDMEWSMLTDAEKGQLVSMWILAADRNGAIPNDARALQRLLGLDAPPNIQKFKDLGFLTPNGRQDDANVTSQRDDNVASDGRQVDAPEAEAEAETEEKDSSPPASAGPASGNGQVPYHKIVTLYHETCTGLPKVQKLTPARRNQIAARYREDMTDLEQWRTFFARVARAPFLNGDNDRAWRADLEWITKQGNYAKIIEGKYDKAKPADKAGSTEPQTLADFPIDWRDNPPLLDDGSPNPEYMPKPPHREAWTALTGLPPIPGAK